MILLSLLLPASANIPPPIVNGSPTSDFEQVGMFQGCSAADPSDCWTCSGTLIAAGWVVTAAHCVEDLDLSSGVSFILGPSWNNFVTGSLVLKYWSHPLYLAGNLSAGHDIALLELFTPITSISPMPLNTTALDSSWIGVDLDMVGYGVTASNGGGSSIKRTVDMPISLVGSSVIFLQDSAQQQNICYGDSGGAGIYEAATGQRSLIGVNSFVIGNCENFQAGITPIAEHIPWMESVGFSTTLINTTPETDTEMEDTGVEDTGTESEITLPEPSTEPSTENNNNGNPGGGCSSNSASFSFFAFLGMIGLLKRQQS